jgi:hypothetical protein
MFLSYSAWYDGNLLILLFNKWLPKLYNNNDKDWSNGYINVQCSTHETLVLVTLQYHAMDERYNYLFLALYYITYP